MTADFLTASAYFKPLFRPRLLQNTLEKSIRKEESLIFVSSVCPPYSTTEDGRPDYKGLESGISFNIRKHLEEVPKGINLLRQRGINAVHFFLMADTEVDLLPYLAKIGITEREFIQRCQSSVEAIAVEVKRIYTGVDFDLLFLPATARFLAYFGEADWYETYNQFREKLFSVIKSDSGEKIKIGLERDARERSGIIRRLLGQEISFEEMVDHILRQKAQYMAFAKLMRDRFEGRLVVINHHTPNFSWMNDKLVRQPVNLKQAESGNFLPEIPLLELDISTVPKEGNE